MKIFTRLEPALLLAAAVCGTVWLAGCGGGNKPSALVGRWVHESGYIDHSPDDLELFEDGTGVFDEEVGVTWKVENKRLVIINRLKALAFEYKVSGSRLTLFDEDVYSVTYYIPVKCGKGDNYHNPRTQFCDGNEVVDRCGGKTYKPATQFCSYGKKIIDKCNGEEFIPANRRCRGNAIEYKCGDGWYKPATQFCSNEEKILDKCNGEEFAPANRRCRDNAMEYKCGDSWYKSAIQFCSNSTLKNYGAVTHGGQTYRTVEIGGNTWMAENLNYTPPSGNSRCYDNNADNCEKYGRLYDWNTARTACPAGWRLPNREEWEELVNMTGGDNAGKKLRAATGWINNGNGTDDYGFSILPNGEGRPDGSFNFAGSFGYLWSATASSTCRVYTVNIDLSERSVRWDNDNASSLAGVRCVQGEAGTGSGKIKGKSVTSADIIGESGFYFDIAAILSGVDDLKSGCDGETDLEKKVISKSRGVITTTDVVKSGGRSRASIRRVVKRNIPALRYAYNRRLREKPGLAGRITVMFAIDEFGKVIFVRIVESTMSDSELESTVVARVKSLVFEKIDKPDDVTEVTCPFILD
jgi:uncharacterized protein (TIGR02145 family)